MSHTSGTRYLTYDRALSEALSMYGDAAYAKAVISLEEVILENGDKTGWTEWVLRPAKPWVSPS